jgi:hypothetical protein
MTGNSGLRITIDLRGKLFWFTLTLGGQQHESSRGYQSAVEALEQAELYRRLLRLAKMREQEKVKRLAESQ